MKKICKRSSKEFNTASNRQKYCKTVLCGYCPLREPKDNSKIDLIDIFKQLISEYERSDDELFGLCKENVSNGLEDDTFWGVGNLTQDLQIKPNLREGQLRSKNTLIYNTVQQIGTGLVVGKAEHRTNANQYSKSKLKYTEYFINIETGQYSSTTVKLPYHLAIGLIHDVQ